jgi:hypothetical protein
LKRGREKFHLDHRINLLAGSTISSLDPKFILIAQKRDNFAKNENKIGSMNKIFKYKVKRKKILC